MFELKYLNKLMDRVGLSEKEKKAFMKFHFFLFNVLLFLGLLFIAFRIYGRWGFEKTIIIQLMILSILLRSTLRKINLLFMKKT